MFINLNEIVNKYNLNIKGIIHAGAHKLEELDIYKSLNIKNLVWIEANETIYQASVKDNPDQFILNHTIYDKDDVDLEFNIATNGQSSSVLNFGTHSSLYPAIKFCEKKIVKSKTLKSIIQDYKINMLNYNMLNIDIQGVELRAIIGLGDYLSYIDYIYMEINNDNVYENNDLLVDVDTFLESNKFYRKETCIINGNWGDALYIKTT